MLEASKIAIAELAENLKTLKSNRVRINLPKSESRQKKLLD